MVFGSGRKKGDLECFYQKVFLSILTKRSEYQGYCSGFCTLVCLISKYLRMLELQLFFWLVINCPFQGTKQCIINNALKASVQEAVKV